MVRRIVVAKPTIDNVEQIQTSIRRVVQPFHPKTDVEKALYGEIEACRALIWQCVAGQANHTDLSSQKSAMHSESVYASSTRVKDRISNTSDANEQCNHVDIEFRVNAMKVLDLRKELKRRDLETTGLKKQLQARLREAIINESATTTQPTDTLPCQSGIMKSGQIMEPGKSETTIAAEVQIKNCDESNLIIHDQAKNTETSHDFNAHKTGEETDTQGTDMKLVGQVSSVNTPANAHKGGSFDEDQIMEVSEEKQEKEEPSDKSKVLSSPKRHHEEGASNIKQYWKKLSKPTNSTAIASPMKVPVETHSEQRVKKSPIRMVVKTVQKVLPSEKGCSTQDLVITESKSDLTDDDFDGPISEFSEASAPVEMSKAGSVRDLVSKIQNGTSSASSTGGSGSALSKSLQAKKEARLARMAEIRGKSKPVATPKHVLAPKEYASTLSTLNAVSAPGGVKKNNLAAQMREKAANAAMRKENVSSGVVNQCMASASESGKRDLQQSSLTGSEHRNSNVVSTTTQGFSKKQKVASPMSTYEISDREESDSDSSESESENEKRKKKIPLWAQKANLLPALEQQYNGCIGGQRVDPDEIFPEVQTCDLEAIFGGKKSRYTRRTSSGNWTNDKVTTAEKLVYKRTMGFETHS